MWLKLLCPGHHNILTSWSPSMFFSSLFVKIDFLFNYVYCVYCIRRCVGCKWVPMSKRPEGGILSSGAGVLLMAPNMGLILLLTVWTVESGKGLALKQDLNQPGLHLLCQQCVPTFSSGIWLSHLALWVSHRFDLISQSSFKTYMLVTRAERSAVGVTVEFQLDEI